MSTIRPISPQSPQSLMSPGLPEAAGPMTEDDAGGAYPAVQVPTVVIERRIDPEERAVRLADFDQVAASCLCAAIPGSVLEPLRRLAARAGTPALSGCPRCRSIPWDALSALANALAHHEGALA